MSLSYAEAGYYVYTFCIRLLPRVPQVIAKMQYFGKDVVFICAYSENQSSLTLGYNSRLYQRVRYIDIRYHIILEVLEDLRDGRVD